ncbi:MAG: serine/threonine protein kinase [Actinomycetota bacterium]|nr:serine/threonine protein kinase [Actinomycetota bacterium]
MAGWSVPGVVHLREIREDPIGSRVVARHRITRQPVAVTYLSSELLADPEFCARFSREFEGLARVKDRRVARPHRYVMCDEGAAIVSDHVNGSPLRSVLLAHGAVSTETALVIFKDTLLALAAWHEAGLAHGDIKPENVILTPAGHVRLVDFGLWTFDGRRRLDRSTPFYLAPEQWTDGPAAPAGDVYAATATCFECLVGAPPFYADSPSELWAKHEHATLPIDVIPEPARDLVRSGLARDLRSRSDVQSLLAQVGDVAVRAVGTDWELRGRRELAALLAARSTAPGVTAPGLGSTAEGTHRNPVQLAAVMGGALMLAVGLASPPLAVILPGTPLFGSGGRSPVLAFPDPARDAPVRVVTNGLLADRAPVPGAQAGTAGPVTEARPPILANPVADAQTVPSAAEVRHQDGAAKSQSTTGQSTTGQSTSSMCTQNLIFSAHQPCKAMHPEQPTTDSTTTTPDPIPAIPVSLPVPVELPVPVQLPTAVQLPAPVQAPKSIPIRNKTQPLINSHTKTAPQRWHKEVRTPRHGTTTKTDQKWAKGPQMNPRWGSARSGNAEHRSAGSGGAGNE